MEATPINLYSLGSDVELETTTINVSAVGTFPFNEVFGVMGRLGFVSSDLDVKVRDRDDVFGGSGSDDYDTKTAFSCNWPWLLCRSHKELPVLLEYEAAKPDFDDLDLDVDLSFISLSAADKFTF